MPILGITGGIATGKSCFTSCLNRILPAEIFDADQCARELTSNNTAIKRAIIAEFGGKVAPAGEIDREQLRNIVFSQPEKRNKLEAILHPVIRSRWMELAKKNRDSNSKNWLYVDIPLLFETRAEECFDKIVVVACSANTQRQRLMSTRKLSAEMADRMISSQMALTLKIEKADHVVWTNSTVLHLEQQAGILAACLAGT